MMIPNLKYMNPVDRSELQAWCMEVVRQLKSITEGRYQLLPKQVIDARDATVPTGLTTKRQMENAVANLSTDIDTVIAQAVNKLKQDNNLV